MACPRDAWINRRSTNIPLLKHALPLSRFGIPIEEFVGDEEEEG